MFPLQKTNLLIAFLFFLTSVFSTPAFGNKDFPISPTPFLNGTFRALVIGNNEYRDPYGFWPSLNTAVSDAQAVAKLLREELGVGDITLLKDATRKDIIQAFNDLAARTKYNDSVLIYYAGHGHLRSETNEGFWIPVDAEGKDDST